MRPFFIILSLIATTNICLSCECAEENDVDTELGQSDVVVVGRVIEILDEGQYRLLGKSNHSWGYKVKVEILTTFKGVDRSEFVVIEGSGNNCDFDFKKDTDYLIYADKVDGKFLTSICTRTAIAKGNPDLEELKK